MAATEKEKWQDVALVDISYEVLEQANKALNYREIFQEAAKLKGLTDEELMELIPQVYTEMNLDGRFICITHGQWGLKKWYTSEAIEESVEALARKKGIDDDDDYGIEEEEEIVEEVFADAEPFKKKKNARAKSDDDDDDDDLDEALEEDEDEEELDFDEEEEEEEAFDEEFDDEDSDDLDDDK